MLAERKIADRASGRSRAGAHLELVRSLRLFAEPDRQLPGKRGPFAHRDVERASDEWHERPLADDRDEHDDEHDPVDAVGPGDTAEQRRTRRAGSAPPPSGRSR